MNYTKAENASNKFIDNTKKLNQMNMKCFQFNCVAWSNLYRGAVARTAIEKIIINKVLKTKIM